MRAHPLGSDSDRAVAGVLAARDELPKPAAALVTATAVGGVAAGIAALLSGGQKSAAAEPATAE